MFLVATDTFLVAPLLPALTARFGSSPAVAGWMVSAYAVGYCITAVFAGPVSDRFDRKRMLVTGMVVKGGITDVAGIIALGALVNIACSLWTLGLAFRYQSVDIGSFMQTPVFVLLFLAPVYVPLALLTGWLHGAASINPITLILDASRGFITGEPDEVLYAFAASLAARRVPLAAKQKADAKAAKLAKKNSTDPRDWGWFKQIVETYKMTAKVSIIFSTFSLLSLS